MQLSGPGEHFGHLIGGHGVKAAAEGSQLHQFEIGPRADQRRRPVEPRMVGPLVHDPQRPAHLGKVRDAVLAEHRRAERSDEIGQPVMNGGIGVIGPAGEHHGEPAGSFRLGQRPFPFGPQFGAVGFLLARRPADGGAEFVLGDAEKLVQRVHEAFRVVQGEERRKQFTTLFAEFLRIQAHDLGIARHHRAVIAVVGGRAFLALAGQAGKENAFDATPQEGRDVPVRELRGIAHGLGGH